MVGIVKNIEHPKLIFSSPKKATNIFKGEYPIPFPNLGGIKPRSKAVPRVAS